MKQLMKLALGVCIAIALNTGIVHASVKPRRVKIEHVYTKKDINCLAKNIFYEAGVEPDKGKYAVGQVTINRLESGKYGKTICAVVYDHCQFSWVCLRHYTAKGKNWERSKQIAEQMLVYHVRVYEVRDALFYHEARIGKPRWTKGMIRVAHIGSHVFYKHGNDILLARE